MTAQEFESRTGYAPERDDLDRVNCPQAGELGHRDCGWCETHDRPRFSCGGECKRCSRCPAREQPMSNPTHCIECGRELWTYQERVGLCSKCLQDEWDSTDYESAPLEASDMPSEDEP